MGESGVGKSELALALLDRGHQLIADDTPQFTLRDDQTLVGTCPPALKNRLEIRGLGIFDITTLFGKKSVVEQETLSLVIRLQKTDFIHRKTDDQSTQLQAIMNVAVPHIRLPYHHFRRFDLIVEALVRNHIHQNLRITL